MNILWRGGGEIVLLRHLPALIVNGEVTLLIFLIYDHAGYITKVTIKILLCTDKNQVEH